MELPASTASMEEDDLKRRTELETTILEKVGDVISSVNDAKRVDQVICALHSLAVLLFPIDSHAFSGSIDHEYREQILRAKAPSDAERNDLWRAFYHGWAFPTLVRVLLCDVASNWLACFPFSAKKHVYDVFFVNGLATEVVQTVIHFLQRNESDTFDANAICSNAERLLILHLIESDGVLRMAREFDGRCQPQDFSNEPLKITISRMAQLVTSIPDKVRFEAPDSLASHFFFRKITIQFLAGAEDWDKNLNGKAAIFNKNDMDGTILFVGESLARICRRGAADVLASEMIPRILRHVQNFLLKNSGLTVGEDFGSKPGFRFWFKMIEAIKDTYAIERMSEQLLHRLVAENASDVEAYWILWVLFHQMYEHQTSIRFMFVDKFLLWKVFPVRCLRWILQFAVLGCPPHATSPNTGHNTQRLKDTVQRLLATWSKREFVQSASMEQQTYITAALGLSLENMSKEDLDATKDAMHSILQGVSCRLESPAPLVRRMASNIALLFSKVVDPKNPLYLDDSCHEETIDWEFGLATDERVDRLTAHNKESEINKVKACSSMLPEKEFSDRTHNGVDNNAKNRKKKLSDFKLIDPDEIIDPVTLNNESISGDEEDDDASHTSETSSDSSLQPYDLSDDDSDLKRKFSQLVDVVGALRKSDDADGVERALDVAEKLVRASPDELRYVASDLVRTLIQVRCSDSTIDGEEESAEEKRQKALVALITKSPFESLDTLHKLLYAPSVDVSQRIMILDVMADATEELANARTIKVRHQPRFLISTTSDTLPWFMPSSTGPPGAGSWKEISGTGTGTGMLLNWSYSYERELPPKPGQIKKGKTRRWSFRSENIQENQMELSQNEFPQYAAAFMLPAMRGYDKKRHGVDLLGRDFIVLGKLVYMLGVCMKCAALHPEASALALPLMDMLSSREICHHVEAYVRRSVLFAASCILVALNPSYIASALVEGNSEFSKGLEWIRTWALHVAESDTDRECYTMAMTCLQLHTEMAFQASRAIELAESAFSVKTIGLPSNLLKGSIKIPYLGMKW